MTQLPRLPLLRIPVGDALALSRRQLLCAASAFALGSTGCARLLAGTDFARRVVNDPSSDDVRPVLRGLVRAILPFDHSSFPPIAQARVEAEVLRLFPVDESVVRRGVRALPHLQQALRSEHARLHRLWLLRRGLRLRRETGHAGRLPARRARARRRSCTTATWSGCVSSAAAARSSRSAPRPASSRHARARAPTRSQKEGVEFTAKLVVVAGGRPRPRDRSRRRKFHSRVPHADERSAALDDVPHAVESGAP